MAKLVTLAKKGPLGAAGTQVWVDDDAPEAQNAGAEPTAASVAQPAQDVAAEAPPAAS
jgi:hypothetical protein